MDQIKDDTVTEKKMEESLDKDGSIISELNVPIISLTIGEGSEASSEKEIQTDTTPLNNYRDKKESDLEDSSDDSDLSSDDSDSDSDSFLEKMRKDCKYTPAPKTYNVRPPDDDYADSIPIEDLNISLDESEIEKIGTVGGIVEYMTSLFLVSIKSIKGKKPLQIPSVVFLSAENPLGCLCDVYGPVVEPFYSVRLNSREHIERVGVEVGMDVFFAPNRPDLTKYVFPEELQRYKGSDASVMNDIEPSDDNIDYSDDEKEKEAKSRRKKSRRPAPGKDSRCEADSQEPSRGSSEPNANPFYSMNKDSADVPNWNLDRHTKRSSYNHLPPYPARNDHDYRERRMEENRSSYKPHLNRAHTPPTGSYQREIPYYDSPQSPFRPPVSPYPQPDQSPFQPPSPLVRIQFQAPPQAGPIHFPPPSPLPTQRAILQTAARYVRQQPQPPVGTPRPICLSQMHMFGQVTPMSPNASHLSYALPNINSPPPSTAFPPASPNFSYFSHPFPSAPSPGPNMSQFRTTPSPGAMHQNMGNMAHFRATPSPGGMHQNMGNMSHFQATPTPVTIHQNMGTMSHFQAAPSGPIHQNMGNTMAPLSIQIPNMRSPPPVIVANGYNQNHGNHNVLQQQQNFGGYRPMQRY